MLQHNYIGKKIGSNKMTWMRFKTLIGFCLVTHSANAISDELDPLAREWSSFDKSRYELIYLKEGKGTPNSN